MTPDLSKFEEKHKQTLLETIWSTLWIGLEDLMRTMGFGKKSWAQKGGSTKEEQISLDLDKFENAKIYKKK